MHATFQWPSPPGCSQEPVWTGRRFQVGGAEVPVLSYGVGESGWNDDLTAFHEDTAGTDHPIDRASRDHAVRQLKQYMRSAAPVILEVGCSSGFLLESMRREIPGALVIGSDYVRGPLEALSKRLAGVPLVQFDLVHCPLPDNCVDAVVLLNVLEHIENDVQAVHHLHRILKPGGVAVIEVPAGPHLYDVYDKVLMHFRRYTLRGLKQLVGEAGLSVESASSLGAFLYPAFWWTKKRNRRYLDAPPEKQKEVVASAIRKTGRSRLMEWVVGLETWVGRWVSYPVGIRCLVTCRKPLS